MAGNFRWTPEFWQSWREANNVYRRYKSYRDRELAMQLMALKDGERVLEIGCGYGWTSEYLLRTVRIQHIGIDISLEMLKNSLQGVSTYAASLVQADALSLPFEDRIFDKILCSGVLMHLTDEFQALCEMRRVLCPGGRLVISGNNLLSPYAPIVMLWNLHKKSV